MCLLPQMLQRDTAARPSLDDILAHPWIVRHTTSSGARATAAVPPREISRIAGPVSSKAAVVLEEDHSEGL